METMEEFERRVHRCLDKKNTKELCDYLLNKPENVQFFLDIVYVERQSVQRQLKICDYLLLRLDYDSNNNLNNLEGL